MLAVDTNVVVRFLTRDHPHQSPRARDLLLGHDSWLGVTVVLESEWVLRSAYRFSRSQVLAALRSLGGLPRLLIEHPIAVRRALALHEAGMDFADAMHLALGDHCDAFVT